MKYNSWTKWCWPLSISQVTICYGCILGYGCGPWHNFPCPISSIRYHFERQFDNMIEETLTLHFKVSYSKIIFSKILVFSNRGFNLKNPKVDRSISNLWNRKFSKSGFDGFDRRQSLILSISVFSKFLISLSGCFNFTSSIGHGSTRGHQKMSA